MSGWWTAEEPLRADSPARSCERHRWGLPGHDAPGDCPTCRSDAAEAAQRWAAECAARAARWESAPRLTAAHGREVEVVTDWDRGTTARVPVAEALRRWPEARVVHVPGEGMCLWPTELSAGRFLLS